MVEQFHSIGKSAWRKDGIAKVTGAVRYTSDMSLPRMWHARVCRSPYAHARVLSIDTSAAEAMGAVKIEYEILPPVLDPEEAMQPDSAQLYETIMLG